MSRKVPAKAVKLSDPKQVVFHWSLHKKLWTILAEHPKMSKYDILKEYFTPEERLAFGTNPCLACSYVDELEQAITQKGGRRLMVLPCTPCPFNVDRVDTWYQTTSLCLGGLFKKWYEATVSRDTESTIRYARKIANLPIREDVNYI